ncbi:MAG: hypothetical protein E7573_03630 [Ruminococcaceae bacterium]|nr:hypothetical protein [Oscillospiraceae bacterium]
MRKMYLAIFLIILVVLVFVGCKSFVPSFEITTPGEEITDSQGETQDAPSVNNNTDPTQEVTQPQDGNEGTTSVSINENETSGPVIDNPAPASSEYDILKSGSFHMIGSMVDRSGTAAPMEVAVTGNSIYMLSDFEGAQMGMLVSNDTVYMIYPAKQAYLELSDSIMSMAGLEIDELISSDQINFSSYGDLNKADSVTEETYDGKTCQVYHFNADDGGETRVYMSGTELMRLATYNASGKFLSSTDIETISATVPADKSAPPSSYKGYKGLTGMMSFMTLLGDLME